MIATPQHHIVPTCSSCQSTNIVKDGCAEWDTDTQTWVLRTVFDDVICDDCGHTHVEDVPILTRTDHSVLNHDEAGHTEFSTWLLPPNNPDPEQIHQHVPEPTHCQHAHDCCGNLYASKAQIHRTTNPLMFVTMQQFRRNI